MSNCDCNHERVEFKQPDGVPGWKVTTFASDGTVYEDSEDDHCELIDDFIAALKRGDEQPAMASFNEAAERTLERARSIHMQRGNEYQDSWALANVHAPFLRHVMREVFGISSATPAELRLLLAAALVDVKDSRMGGEFKLDTIDDGINYRAAFASWMEDYLNTDG